MDKTKKEGNFFSRNIAGFFILFVVVAFLIVLITTPPSDELDVTLSVVGFREFTIINNSFEDLNNIKVSMRPNFSCETPDFIPARGSIEFRIADCTYKGFEMKSSEVEIVIIEASNGKRVIDLR